VVISHDGETRTAVPLQAQYAGGATVYTIQLPPAPKQPAPKKRSLWWVPLALIAALLLGVLLGAAVYPLLSGQTTPTAAPTQTPPSGSAEPGESAAARIYRENVDAVVGITATPYSSPESSVYIPPSTGTGFLISGDGYILTNAHVISSIVNGKGEIRVRLSDGTEYAAALVAAESQTSDLALLKIEASGLRTVILGDSDTVKVGDWLCTIGNPLGELDFSLTAGYLSAAARQVNTGSTTLTMLQTNTAVNKGNSGGPLFDAAGQVIGIVTAKITASEAENTVEGLGFALPINDVMAIVRPWLEGQKNG
jgi:serine protease Do